MATGGYIYYPTTGYGYAANTTQTISVDTVTYPYVDQILQQDTLPATLPEVVEIQREYNKLNDHIQKHVECIDPFKKLCNHSFHDLLSDFDKMLQTKWGKGNA